MVPVEVRFTAELPQGYRMVSSSVQPPQLRIAGADNRVSAVNSVQTDAIDLSRMTKSGDYRVNAFVPDPEVRFDSSPLVTVSVTIERNGKTE